MDDYPSRRITDGQIESLHGEIKDLRSELGMKATHEDIRRVESLVVNRFAELKQAIERRVTLDRYRPTELAVATAVAALCGAVFALSWRFIAAQLG